jgi:Flp pilus assembly protein TadG
MRDILFTATFSAADDLTLLRERRQKKTYDAIFLQDPTRTAKSLSAHFERTIKNRLADKKSFTLNAEWTAKYQIAEGWAVREGVRVTQLSQWNSSSPDVRTLTSATIRRIQQLPYTHPSFKKVVDALTSGDQHLAYVIPLNRQELLSRLNPSAICGTDLWCTLGLLNPVRFLPHLDIDRSE